MGSEEGGQAGGGVRYSTGTDARISRAKQKHLTKINTSKTNRLHENSESDSPCSARYALNGNLAHPTCQPLVRSSFLG